MAEWKKYTLQDLATIKYGKNQKDVVSQSGTIPIFGTGGLMGYATKPLYSEPSVLIGRKGTIEKVHYVTEPFWTVDTLFYTIINKELVTPYFFYCLMQLVDLKKLNEGTTIPSLRTETLNRLTFNVPPLPTQKKIAEVLSCLDSKIELNRRINENLEQQAQAIFKEWFVNNAKPEWKVGKLGDIIEITSGKRPLKKQDEFSDEFNIPIVGAANIMGYTNNTLYNEKILITGRVGTHGIIQKFSEKCWPSDNTLVVKSAYYGFVYQILKSIDFSSLNRGSTQPLITQSDIKRIEVYIPPKELLLKYEEFITTNFVMQETHEKQSQTLAQIRDSLLPKLMNGELEV